MSTDKLYGDDEKLVRDELGTKDDDEQGWTFNI